MVDLAGSERLDKSHSKGESLEEAKFINRSLSALSNVFINIRNNSPHVNFRDSKLTMILKDCLSKEGKTLMFVNLSPAIESAQESLCSLNFAAGWNSSWRRTASSDHFSMIESRGMPICFIMNAYFPLPP